MRKALLLCVALALVCGSSYGLTYTWINTATTGAGRDWQTGANWDLGAAPGATDDAVIANGGYATTTANIDVGSLRTGGTSLYDMGAFSLTVGAGGGTGDLFLRAGAQTGTNAVTVYGNYLYSGTSSANPLNALNMMGTSKAFSNQNQRYGWTQINIWGTAWDNGSGATYPWDSRMIVSVKSGGKILKRPANIASRWAAWWYDLADGQANLPNWNDCVTIQYTGNTADNGLVKNAIRGGVDYGYDLTVEQLYSGRKATDQTWRVKGGSFKVARNFTVGAGRMETNNPALKGNFVFSSVENGTSTSVDFSVGGDVIVGKAAGSGYDCEPLSILKLNNSTVHIGGTLEIGRRCDANYNSMGTADLGSATIYLGRNLYIHDPKPTSSPIQVRTIDYWNEGTSTIICDGNGISLTQEIMTTSYKQGTTAADRYALHNLIIRNPGGTVSLRANSSIPNNTQGDTRAGELYLTGDLLIDCGTFKDNTKSITFNGPAHLLKVDGSASVNPDVLAGHTPGYFDNIILLSNAVLNLGSNIGMDNIEMQSGSKLYLLGFTLMADGKTWISNQVDNTGVAYDQGTIFGTLVVPEPATLLLLGTGALGVLGCIRRRRMR